MKQEASLAAQILGGTRLAGVLYLLIVAAGIWAEGVVRAGLIVPGDPVQTAGNIAASEGLFRAALLADTGMAVSDAAVAVLLFELFRPVHAPLALMAMVFRLLQTGVIAVAILTLQAALLAQSAPDRMQQFLDLHAIGYDLGLIFFGVNCLLTAVLLGRFGGVARLLGWGVGAAGLVYLTGSTLRLVAPEWVAVFQPAYLVPVIAEFGFALWLLLRRGPRAAGAIAGGSHA